MTYLGNTAEQQAFTPAVDYFSGNASTTAFTLSRPVASVAQVQVFIENVPQNPSSAFTVSSNTITFTSAPPSGSNNIYVLYTSPITQVAALPQNPQIFGSLQFSSLGARITGDFSNATFANRVAFQTSTTNGSSSVSVLPNGTGNSSSFQSFNNSDPTNAGRIYINATNSSANIASDITGTGTYLPLLMLTGGSERLRIDTSGNVGIGTNNPTAPLTIASSSTLSAGSLSVTLFGANNTERIGIYSNPQPVFAGYRFNGTYASPTTVINGDILCDIQGRGYDTAAYNLGTRVVSAASGTWSTTSRPADLIFYTTASGSTSTLERMRIDSAGNVFVGGTTQNASTAPVYASTTAKAWIRFNGTASTITGSFNVGSLTKNGTGDYRINFTAALANTNYSVSGAAKTSDNNTAGGNNNTFAPYSFATGSVSMLSIDAGSGLVKDSAVMCAQVFAV